MNSFENGTTRVALVDVAAVSGAAILYVLLEALHVPKRWSFGTIGLAFALYAVFFFKTRSHEWRTLGFRTDNLRAALLPIGVSTLLAAGALAGWAVAHGSAVWNSEMLVLITLYPGWALIQQLAFQGLLHRGLMVLVPSPILQVLIVASAFASVHSGNLALVGLTFVAGLMWSVIYRRWPNLWLISASHTILAALAYPLVLTDAPLSRF
jgi:uncharacterized membrane protein